MIYWVDGSPFEVRIPTAESWYERMTQQKVIDRIIVSERSLLRNAYTLGKENTIAVATETVGELGEVQKTAHDATLGFRLDIIPLEADLTTQNLRCLNGIPDGKLLHLGTLYVNGAAIRQDASAKDCVERYDRRRGRPRMRLGNTSTDERYRIQVVKWMGMLCSTKNLLVNVSWEEVAKFFSPALELPGEPKTIAIHIPF